MKDQLIAGTEIQIVPYQAQYRQQVFDFTDRCFSELGKRFEPEGRHSFYNDIPGVFAAFMGETVIGTVALKRLSDDTAALKLYEKTGFRRIERCNDNARADNYMKLEL